MLTLWLCNLLVQEAAIARDYIWQKSLPLLVGNGGKKSTMLKKVLSHLPPLHLHLHLRSPFSHLLLPTLVNLIIRLIICLVIITRQKQGNHRQETARVSVIKVFFHCVIYHTFAMIFPFNQLHVTVLGLSHY